MFRNSAKPQRECTGKVEEGTSPLNQASKNQVDTARKRLARNASTELLIVDALSVTNTDNKPHNNPTYPLRAGTLALALYLPEC